VRHEALASGGSQDTDLPDRSDFAVSLRVALRARALPWLAVRGQLRWRHL